MVESLNFFFIGDCPISFPIAFDCWITHDGSDAKWFEIYWQDNKKRKEIWSIKYLFTMFLSAIIVSVVNSTYFRHETVTPPTSGVRLLAWRCGLRLLWRNGFVVLQLVIIGFIGLVRKKNNICIFGLCGSIHRNLLFYSSASSRPIFVLLFYAQCGKALKSFRVPAAGATRKMARGGNWFSRNHHASVTVHTAGRNEEHADEDITQNNSL